MSDYNNEGRGALFPRQKQPGDNVNAPDYRGEVVIDGRKYWIAGWRAESKRGARYLSLAFTEADEQNDRPPHQRKGDGNQRSRGDGRPQQQGGGRWQPPRQQQQHQQQQQPYDEDEIPF